STSPASTSRPGPTPSATGCGSTSAAPIARRTPSPMKRNIRACGSARAVALCRSAPITASPRGPPHCPSSPPPISPSPRPRPPPPPQSGRGRGHDWVSEGIPPPPPLLSAKGPGAPPPRRRLPRLLPCRPHPPDPARRSRAPQVGESQLQCRGTVFLDRSHLHLG